MKYLISSILLSAIFVSCFEKKDIAEPCIKIKFINGVCGTNVYQILDANYYSYGQNNWTNPFNGQVLDHVFTLKNHCATITLAADSTTNVKFIDAPANNCAICLAIYPGTPPAKTNSVAACN
jgi:hypothetical protein